MPHRYGMLMIRVKDGFGISEKESGKPRKSYEDVKLQALFEVEHFKNKNNCFQASMENGEDSEGRQMGIT